MSRCDVCHEPIEKGEGLLHSTERLLDSSPEVMGFAFYPWADVPERFPIGRIHKRCLRTQLHKYLERFEMGRLALPAARIIITRKKMAGRAAR
jgi:hypothetical protein